MKKTGRMNSFFTLLIAVLFAVFPMTSVFADTESHNPIFGLPSICAETATEDRFINILLLGVDFGFDGYWGSGNKQVLKECHTDAFMIMSINLTKSRISLISVPRDTVTYVPGVKGIYKLNGVFNCADTLEQGFLRACDVASQMLGGIRIDHYACVDMNAMVELGDAIGGVDIDVEMNYSSGKRSYQKGMQHLDGAGMMDYARARKNATYNANDIGRTSRQRQVVEAIVRKLISRPKLVKTAWDYANSEICNFFTDLKLGTLLNLMNQIKECSNMESYVMSGKTQLLANWVFTVTDQEMRKNIIKTVYGINTDEMRYVGSNYINWLADEGFDYVHTINLAEEIITHANGMTKQTDKQKQAVEALVNALHSMVISFDEIADKEGMVSNTVRDAFKTLQSVGDVAATELHYSEKALQWKKTGAWNNDPYINVYRFNWA